MDRMHSLAEFLFPAPAPRSVPAIIGWWERRRFFFNLAVGLGGLVTMTAITTVASIAVGRLVLEPWLGAVAFGVMANVCYCLGPATEIFILKIWDRAVLPTGPALYRMGLTFSVGLALLPTFVLGFLAMLWLGIANFT
jgi:hypothetical protein